MQQEVILVTLRGSLSIIFQFWDSRKKIAIDTYQSNYQVTAVSFTDTAEQLISGGIDNEIKV